MKFKYDGVTEQRGMVAFIDDEGDLCVHIGCGVVYMIQDGDGFYVDNGDFQGYADDNGVRKAFYPGDKITITF